MLRMVTVTRKKQTEESIVDSLVKDVTLNMSAADVCFDPRDTDSCKLLKTLHQTQVTHRGFKYLAQLGQPTDEALRRSYTYNPNHLTLMQSHQCHTCTTT
jgi:hypothetical protein